MMGAVGVALCFAFGLYAFRGAIWISGPNIVEETPAEELTPVWRHPLTGAPLEAEMEPPSVFGVMVENSIEAWPLSGVEEAFLVIEAPVEAAIPRFIAFYGEDQEVEKIGPVRSARPYYVDWANEFEALYAHVGGSNAALDLIAYNGTFDLNEFSNGNYFWRATSRFAPHNAYTSTELLQKALLRSVELEQAPEAVYGVWLFKEDGPAAIVQENSFPIYPAGGVERDQEAFQRYSGSPRPDDGH